MMILNRTRFLLCLCAASHAHAGFTGYHIGNSLTWDSQPLAIQDLAAQRSIDYSAGYHIKGGASLDEILDAPTDFTEIRAPYSTYDNALPNHVWDWVTFQPHPSSDGDSTLATDAAAALDIIDLTRSNPGNRATAFYMYAAWPTQIGFPESWEDPVANDDTTRTVNARNYHSHLIERIRSETDADVRMIPVGEVLYRLSDRIDNQEIPGLFGVQLLYRDLVHLSYGLGRYIAGATTFATLFQQHPAGLVRPEDYYMQGEFEFGEFNDEFYRIVHETIWDVVATHPYTGLNQDGRFRNTPDQTQFDASPNASIPSPSTALLLLVTTLSKARRRR